MFSACSNSLGVSFVAMPSSRVVPIPEPASIAIAIDDLNRLRHVTAPLVNRFHCTFQRYRGNYLRLYQCSALYRRRFQSGRRTGAQRERYMH